MSAADGQVVIVFNGEIYNFRELARGLKAGGYHFRSHCDTEVLLAMYLEHGTAMLAASQRHLRIRDLGFS